MSQSQHSNSIVAGAMRRVFIPATIALEVVALIDRVLETGTQFTRPALYGAWSATGLSTAMFFLVLIAIAVGTAPLDRPCTED